ncbi:MATE family efflux transporter [Aureimonas frigidaquae]|uniref:MATE family efflux transporter n=1 Tax=Aureimonas frigidaquae TaxID=424757 RepID=UPI000782A225|nr:MATE family efflux transporter [Aureimonas frigidaquae]
MQGQAKPDVPVRAGTWGSHLRATLVLGLPLVGAQLAQVAVNVTNTVMLGWLGSFELAAAVLSWQLFYVVWMFGSGFGYAVMPLAAGAVGAGDPRAVRRSVRMGLWVVLAYSAAMMIPLWHVQAVLLWLGQEPAVAALAQDYMRWLQWSLAPQLVIIVLRSFLSSIDRPQVVLAALCVGVAANALLNYGLVFGHFGLPALGMAGSGIATTISISAVALALLAYCSRHRALRVYEILVRFHRPDWVALADVSRLGWPIGATIVAEVGLFSATSIMMGWISPLQLAAHGIALQLSGTAFMVPLGLAGAATIRVGRAYGARNAAAISRAARACLGVGVGFACSAALLFWAAPHALVGLYLDPGDPQSLQVLAYAVPFLAVAAAFQLVDTIQVLSSGVLRGLKDTRLPMIIAIFSYWCIGMPTSYVLAFPLGWGGLGVWIGLAFGLATSAVLMTARFLRREARGALLQGA